MLSSGFFFLTYASVQNHIFVAIVYLVLMLIEFFCVFKNQVKLYVFCLVLIMHITFIIAFIPI